MASWPNGLVLSFHARFRKDYRLSLFRRLDHTMGCLKTFIEISKKNVLEWVPFNERCLHVSGRLFEVKKPFHNFDFVFTR